MMIHDIWKRSPQTLRFRSDRSVLLGIRKANFARILQKELDNPASWPGFGTLVTLSLLTLHSHE